MRQPRAPGSIEKFSSNVAAWIEQTAIKGSAIFIQQRPDVPKELLTVFSG
jgi:hypothetical protein